MLKAAGIANYDFTVVRNTSLTERFKLEFRTEFFNLFNHAEFLNPSVSMTSSLFGQISSTNAARIIQLAARLSF